MKSSEKKTSYSVLCIALLHCKSTCVILAEPFCTPLTEITLSSTLERVNYSLNVTNASHNATWNDKKS